MAMGYISSKQRRQNTRNRILNLAYLHTQATALCSLTPKHKQRARRGAGKNPNLCCMSAIHIWYYFLFHMHVYIIMVQPQYKMS